MEIFRLAHVGRVAQGDGGFDGTPKDGGFQPEPLHRFLFSVGGGHVLGFDHHGRAAGRGDEDVGPKSRVSGDNAGVLGTDLAAGQHRLEQVAQCVVGARFGLVRHTTMLFCQQLKEVSAGLSYI